MKIIAKEPSILHEAFPSQFRKLVIRPAKRLGTPLRPITIVIDALDECNSPTDQVQLLNLIFEAITSMHIRVLIASRPEQYIHAFFQRKDVSHHTYHIRLDEGTFNTNKDIEILLRSEFARIRLSRPEVCRPLPNGEEWPGDVVVYRLRDDSDCQFIYSRLAIDYIDTPFFSPDQQLKTLLAAPPNRVFSKLDALYHHILSRRPPELPAGSDELLAFQKLVMGILRVVISWPSPLSATGIARVLDKDVDVVQSIVRGAMCSLFKFDPNDVDSSIALCHKSLRDYLLDRHRSQEFFLPSAETDTLFTRVLTRISPPDVQQPYRARELLVGVLAVVVACLLWANLYQTGSVLKVVPRPIAEEATLIPTMTLVKPDALDTTLRLAESSTHTHNPAGQVDHSTASRDEFKQSGEFSGLLQRFLLTFTTFPFISQVGDVINNGSNDTPASTAQTQTATRGAAPRDAYPANKRTMQKDLPLPLVQEQCRRTDGHLETMTIHFLKGSTTYVDLPKLVEKLNSVSTTAGGRVDSAQKILYFHLDRGLPPHGSYRILLTCSNAFHSFFDGLQSLDLSSLWGARCVVHLRRGETIDYGLRVSMPYLAHAMDSGTQRELQTALLVAIKEEYPRRALGRQVSPVTVTKELAAGFYIFSGPIGQDLEDIVGRGPQKVPVHCPRVAALLASQSGGDSFDVTISPFRLYDMPPEAIASSIRDAEHYFSSS